VKNLEKRKERKKPYCNAGHLVDVNNSHVDKDGYSHCKICKQIRWEKWHKTHWEEQRVRSKKNQHTYRLRHLYNLTPEQYEEMYKKQQGLCILPSCGSPVADIDHDHSTGETRALMCHKHNLAIGQFDDNSQLMREAADYVDSFKRKLWPDQILA
jgi:hypothetical protein